MSILTTINLRMSGLINIFAIKTIKQLNKMERIIFVSLGNSDNDAFGILNLGVVSVSHSSIEEECKQETELIQNLIRKIAPVAMRQHYGEICEIKSFEVFDLTPVNFEMRVQMGEIENPDSYLETIWVKETCIYSIADVEPVIDKERTFRLSNDMGETTSIIVTDNNAKLNDEVAKAINVDNGFEEMLSPTDLDMTELEMENIKYGDDQYEFIVVLPTGNHYYYLEDVSNH